MSNEFATSLTDILLCVGTFLLALNVKSTKAKNTWRSVFIALAAAAGFGAIYHGTEKFQVHEFWVLISASTMISSFLFFAACSVVARPTWKWLDWLWPLYGFVGLLTGVLLSSKPFWVLSFVSGGLIILSVIILQKCNPKEVRGWIVAGVGVSILGFLVQKFTNFDGILSHNSLFHLFQLTGNYLIWRGANKA
jgi:hypothetical protein